MSNILEYKGYYTKVEYCREDNILYGKIEGVNDLVNFECETAEDVEKEFRMAVDDYLSLCSEMGVEPDKTYKGTFNVRITPTLHKEVAQLAYNNNESLNQVVEKAIQYYTHMHSEYK